VRFSQNDRRGCPSLKDPLSVNLAPRFESKPRVRRDLRVNFLGAIMKRILGTLILTAALTAPGLAADLAVRTLYEGAHPQLERPHAGVNYHFN
jgi:hypothetical protein